MDLFPRREAAACGLGGREVSAQPKLVDEIKKMEREPLLPVEKKLIGWSLCLGVILLGLLIWASYTFFPTGAGH